MVIYHHEYNFIIFVEVQLLNEYICDTSRQIEAFALKPAL